MGVFFCFLVPDEVEDEDKGKDSEGGAAGGGWGSDDTVKTFSISDSCGNTTQCFRLWSVTIQWTAHSQSADLPGLAKHNLDFIMGSMW